MRRPVSIVRQKGLAITSPTGRPSLLTDSPISRALATAEGIARADTGVLPNSFSELDAWGIGGSFVADLFSRDAA
jgi:hypothetical protein